MISPTAPLPSFLSLVFRSLQPPLRNTAALRKFVVLLPLISCSPSFPQSLTAEQVRADVDTVVRVLSDIHPTFNESPRKQALLNLRDTIRSPATVHELFKILQPLVAVDGHTTLRFTGAVYPAVENPLLPFETVVFNNKLYVKRNLSTDSLLHKGTEITLINGMPAPEVIETLLPYMPGERSEYKIRKLDNNGFTNWYRLVFGNFETFEIQYKGPDEIHTTTVEGIHWAQLPKHEEIQLKFQILDGNVAYLKIGNFRRPKIFLPFIDSVFTEIKNHSIENLIIDKTEGGGITNLTDSLLIYITDKPYCEFEKKKIRISEETEEFIEELKESGEQEGEFFIVSRTPRPPACRPNRFTGRVYIITGPKAYSAATIFVAMAKCYSDAIIVGEETGQPLISNADLSRVKLPNSGMYIYTSLSVYFMPCAVNTQDGVKPDIEVKLTLDDLLKDTEKYLNHTIRLIKQQE